MHILFYIERKYIIIKNRVIDKSDRGIIDIIVTRQKQIKIRDINGIKI